jgi:uncharacterized protein YdaU (DUF1376 family)
MHYYQHHIGDFIKATARLTDGQAMAYLRLLWNYYDKDGILANDPEQIAFEIGSDINTVVLILKTYFEIDGEFIKQSRCDKEIQGYLNKSKGGKKGAEKRWSNEPKDSLPIANLLPTQCEPNANAMPTQCDPNANQEPITNNQEPVLKTKGQALPDWLPLPEFQAFLEYRKSKRNALTSHAQKLLVEKLSGLQASGQDLVAVLNQSILNGWSGVFPIKVDVIKTTGNALTQHNAEVMRQFIGGQK